MIGKERKVNYDGRPHSATIRDFSEDKEELLKEMEEEMKALKDRMRKSQKRITVIEKALTMSHDKENDEDWVMPAQSFGSAYHDD